MTITGFVILVVVAMIAAYVYILLGGLPGKTARARGHPRADAINILGWIGLLLGVAPWLVAMVWSRLDPLEAPALQRASDEEADLDPQDH